MDRAVSLGARRIDLAIEPAFELGRARIDPPAHEITVAGKSARIQPQTLKVLVALHDRLGQVATREELVDRCWDGRIVGEDVINRCILVLRRFAAEAGGFRIETVPRAGYRLVEVSSRLPKATHSTAIIVVLAIVSLSTGVLLLRGRTASPPPSMLSVAIPPFGSDSTDGATRAIASQARASAAHMLAESGISVRMVDAARSEKTADFLISGEFEGEGKRVSALIRIEQPARKAVVYSHRFDTDQTPLTDLPEQIGANLAGTLSWSAPLLVLDRRHPSDPAFIAQLLNQTSTEDSDQMQTYEFARREAPAAPDSAIAQLILAMDTGLVFGVLPADERRNAVMIGRKAADRALALAPKFGDVYVPGCFLRPRVWFAECEDRLRAGLRADPGAPFAPAILSRTLNNVGRIGEALDVAYASHAADPYAPSKIGRLAGMLEAIAAERAADRLYRQGMRWWPTNRNMLWMRYSGIIQRGDFAALARFEDEVGRSSVPGDIPSAAAFVGPMKHNSVPELLRVCPIHEAAPDDVRSIECMIALAETGDVKDALKFADALYPDLGRTRKEQEARWLTSPGQTDTSYLTSPATARLRQDPRFIPLARRTGLLDYWRSGRLPDFCTVRHEAVCARILSKQERS